MIRRALARSPAWGMGIARVRRDRTADYLALRRVRFGCDLAGLPRRPALSAADEALNRRAKLPIARGA
ncbi:MAG TPA: hypothetical protein VMW75_26375 [Thermoanaerobaculia bacterium]|nr:hypothetical protein [Thermoanaerobaculia bacterium]